MWTKLNQSKQGGGKLCQNADANVRSRNFVNPCKPYKHEAADVVKKCILNCAKKLGKC